MASILFRFIFWILILWLLWRVLAKILRPASRPGATGNAAVTPNNMVKDPVCGMYMDSRLALRLEKRKESFYFCSEECRNKYLGESAGGTRSAPPL